MAVKKGLLFSCLLMASLALVSCSAGEMLRTGIELAKSDDPAEALESRLQRTVDSKKHSYEHDPTRIISDVKAAKHEFDHVMSLLMRAVGAEWGDDAKAPTRKRYVKYVQNYKSRAMVDYDSGVITVETLMEDAPRRNLKNAIVTTLLTPEDPRAADLFSAREVKLSGTPFLQGLVDDEKGREINNPGRAEAYAAYLVKNKMQRRTITVEGKSRQVHYARFRMVRDYVNRSARKFEPLVNKYARRYGVSKSLVLAVIRTESNFNPRATSHVPAYGLMQLVPSSGGRDAYRHAKGASKMPGKNYLYDPENNIELGTAYLDLLHSKYFERIQNVTSREYCVISGYNTGSGNVYKTFSADTTAAINKINSMQPPQVYRTLKNHLPYKETRRYLVKVLQYRRQFVSNL